MRDGERALLDARREGYIRRALEAVVPRPPQNIYRFGGPSTCCFIDRTLVLLIWFVG